MQLTTIYQIVSIIFSVTILFGIGYLIYIFTRPQTTDSTIVKDCVENIKNQVVAASIGKNANGDLTGVILDNISQLKSDCANLSITLVDVPTNKFYAYAYDIVNLAYYLPIGTTFTKLNPKMILTICVRGKNSSLTDPVPIRYNVCDNPTTISFIPQS